MCSGVRRCRNLGAWSPRFRDLDPQLGVAQQMTAISLGMPSVPTKLAERGKSRQIQVGTVAVGGDAPVSVQSMTTTRT